MIHADPIRTTAESLKISIIQPWSKLDLHWSSFQHSQENNLQHISKYCFWPFCLYILPKGHKKYSPVTKRCELLLQLSQMNSLYYWTMKLATYKVLYFGSVYSINHLKGWIIRQHKVAMQLISDDLLNRNT